MRSTSAGLALLLLAAPVQAAPTPMVIAWSTWLRAGPGTATRVLNELPAGYLVSVQGCGQGWCRVISGQAEGWVDQTLLAPDRAPPLAKAPGDCFPATHFTPERAIAMQICPATPGP